MLETTNQLTFTDPVIIVGGGSVDSAILSSPALAGWPVVAADGGANTLLKAGINPQAIIGDLDSLDRRDYWEQHTRVIQLTEQDTTDFEKCLYSVDAPLLVAIGFTGNRFDHTLSSLHLLHKYAETTRVLLLTGADVCFAWRGSLQLSLPMYSRFSIYPLSRTEFHSSTGLLYPLHGLTLKQGEMIGTSNRVERPDVEITADPQGIYCVILPIALLQTVVQQLRVL